MAKAMNDTDVLKAYQAAEQFENASRFAAALGVSKQAVSLWLTKGTKPGVEWLQGLAVEYREKWQGNMAVDILRVRGLTVPCVCQTSLGDRGFCPKHSANKSDLLLFKKATK